MGKSKKRKAEPVTQRITPAMQKAIHNMGGDEVMLRSYAKVHKVPFRDVMFEAQKQGFEIQ